MQARTNRPATSITAAIAAMPSIFKISPYRPEPFGNCYCAKRAPPVRREGGALGQSPLLARLYLPSGRRTMNARAHIWRCAIRLTLTLSTDAGHALMSGGMSVNRPARVKTPLLPLRVRRAGPTGPAASSSRSGSRLGGRSGAL
jgi:hypothetical protein